MVSEVVGVSWQAMRMVVARGMGVLMYWVYQSHGAGGIPNKMRATNEG